MAPKTKSLVYLACVVFCCIVCIRYYTKKSHFPITETQIPHQHNALHFKPVNGNGMYTLHDICIELAPGSTRVPLTPDEMVPAKRLVAYNAHTDGIRNLTVAVSHNSHVKTWDILQVKAAIPSSHIYITDHPAYFIIDSPLGNLYHFWTDLYHGLYGILKLTNQLGVSDGSYLYFKGYQDGMRPWHIFNKYFSRERFKTFMCALGIRPGFCMFFNETANTCFRNAVFGWFPTESTEVVDYLATKLPFDSDKCKTKQIVIIQRSVRLILNVDQLKQAANQLGFDNIDVVDFANITIFDQYQLIRCTQILIGINGAGLQWALFMNPGSGLMELSFAKPGFHQHYGFMKGYRHLVYDAYNASKVLPDWHTIGTPYTEEQKQGIINGTLNVISWKFADGEFEVNGFKQTLQSMAKKVFK